MKMNAPVKDEFYLFNNIDKNKQGWLLVEILGIGKREICHGTRLKLLHKKPEFEKVLILDGPYRDYYAKIPYSPNNPYLQKTKKSNTPCMVIYDRKKKLITIKFIGSFTAIMNNSKISHGDYLLEIPTHKHEITPYNYLIEENGGSRFAKTWFRIVQKNTFDSDLFLHYGKKSDGCITVTEKGSWNEIYKHLIKSRSDRMHIGTLRVI